jgi:arginyl-tRNA synthetase
MTTRETLTTALAAAAERARRSGQVTAEAIPVVQLDVPPAPELGDFSSDLAVVLARQSRQSPVEVAEALAGLLDPPQGLVEHVEVGRTGFLNFYLKPEWLHEVIREACRLEADFGKNPAAGAGEAVQVEFVSAQPTGPLTVTHGRGAALGDALATVLEWNGYRVTREFYVNDAGSHMERFGRSLEARYLQAAGRAGAHVPVDGYQARFLVDLAARLKDTRGDEYVSLPPPARLERLTALGRDAVLEHQRETLARFGVCFDEYSSEKALRESGKLQDVLDLLRRNGYAYELDGALWLQTTRFGDDEDRPLLRSNGQPTYIAGDLAYHLEKFRRGFQRVIDIWGPDHAAYVRRTQAGIQALGGSPEALEILIFQHVLLRVDGMVVEGSAHAGSNILLGEVLDEVGKDVARFFYLGAPVSSPLEFDLDLARMKTPENPAWRAQAAHVQACAILRDAAREAPARSGSPSEADLAALDSPWERALMRKLADFPDEVQAAAQERDPYRLTRYLREAAAAFDLCCQQLPPHGGGDPSGAARLALVQASKVVLGNALTVLGISAPERVEERESVEA